MEWNLETYKLVGRNQIEYFFKGCRCEVRKGLDAQDYFDTTFTEEEEAIRFIKWCWEKGVIVKTFKGKSGNFLTRIKVLGMTKVIKDIWNEYFGKKEECKDDKTRN